MKLSMMGRLTKASVVSLAMGLGLTACSRDYTVAWVYVTTNSGTTGNIHNYAVDYQSGALTPLQGQTSVPAGGRDPVTLVVAPNATNLYVALQADNAIAWFAIGTDGKLYQQKTYNTVGSFPTAMAIDPGGKFLFVTVTYQVGYTQALTGPGAVDVFPINSDNSLGTPTVVNVGNNPVGIVVSKFNNFVYVVDQEPAPGKAAVLGFAENTTTGALTPVPGTTITTPPGGKTVATGFGAGTQPTAIAEEPKAQFVYVTDEASNVVYGYVVLAQGQLVAMTQGPFNTGLLPVGLTIDPRGKFMYVVNYNSNTVGSYVLDNATGAPTGAIGGSGTAVGTGPTCVTIEPALGIYLYTSNALDGTVSAEQLDPHTGGLVAIINSPAPAGALPTCAAAVANGSHATQLITP